MPLDARVALTVLIFALALSAPTAAPAAWGPPELLATGMYPREVVANPRGDVAVLLGGGSGIAVAYAAAGRGFGPVEQLTSHSPYFADIALAGNGDAFVIAEGPGGGHRVAIRPSGGAFGPMQELPGVGQFADVAAGPDGQALVSGTSPDHAVALWWREPGGAFARTEQAPFHNVTRAPVAFAGRRAVITWVTGGELRVADVRDGLLADTQTLARGDQVEARTLLGNPRGDLLLSFNSRSFSEYGFPHRTFHAPPGQPLGEVPSPATVSDDGTLALPRGDRTVELRPPAGPPELVEVPADVDREMGMPFVSFNPEGRLEAWGSERRSATEMRVEFAQRAPDGSWCPTRPWDGAAYGQVRSAGSGDRGVAAWLRPGPVAYVSRFRVGERCPAPWVEPPRPGRRPPAPDPLPERAPPREAPRGLTAARRGTRVALRWRPVAGATRYRVQARIGKRGRPRYVRRPARRRAVIGGVRRGARVTVTVRGVGRDGRLGRPALIRVGARR